MGVRELPLKPPSHGAALRAPPCSAVGQPYLGSGSTSPNLQPLIPFTSAHSSQCPGLTAVRILLKGTSGKSFTRTCSPSCSNVQSIRLPISPSFTSRLSLVLGVAVTKPVQPTGSLSSPLRGGSMPASQRML